MLLFVVFTDLERRHKRIDIHQDMTLIRYQYVTIPGF